MTELKAIIEAARVIGDAKHCEVIAEGVETQAQCQFLVKAGCTMVQGFYFAKPLPASELEEKWVPLPLAEGVS